MALALGCDERRGGVLSGEKMAKTKEIDGMHLLLLRVQLFPKSDTKFLAHTLQRLEVLLVLFLVLDLGLDAYYGLLVWVLITRRVVRYPRTPGRRWGSR
jgi:hypothetical protein